MADVEDEGVIGGEPSIEHPSKDDARSNEGENEAVPRPADDAEWFSVRRVPSADDCEQRTEHSARDHSVQEMEDESLDRIVLCVPVSDIVSPELRGRW